MHISLGNLYIMIDKLDHVILIITSNNLDYLAILIDVIVKPLCTLIHKKLGLLHWLYLLKHSEYHIGVRVIKVIINRLKKNKIKCVHYKNYFDSKLFITCFIYKPHPNYTVYLLCILSCSIHQIVFK